MSKKVKELIDKLEAQHSLSRAEWVTVFDEWDEDDRAYAADKAVTAGGA